jgi:hypothetical protein
MPDAPDLPLQPVDIASRSFGVELEHIWPEDVDLRAVRRELPAGWKLVPDESLNSRGQELVSPVLFYEPELLPRLQEPVRQLRRAGAEIDGSCAHHVHVGVDSWTRMQDGGFSRLQDLHTGFRVAQRTLHAVLRTNTPRRNRYARPLREHPEVIGLGTLGNCLYGAVWSSSAPADYRTLRVRAREEGKYAECRYSAVNFHSYFYRGTIEFRLFNGTLHAGQVKAYVQLCLALVAAAENHELTTRVRAAALTAEPGWPDVRRLISALGLTGAEFATLRTLFKRRVEGRHPRLDRPATGRTLMDVLGPTLDAETSDA